MMGRRAEELADRFSQLSQEFISIIEGCTPDQIRTRCQGEQCTVAALASHVAAIQALAAEWIQIAASGQPLPHITMETVNQANAEQFERDADREKGAILRDLRENGARAARLVRGLSDEEMDRTSYFVLFGREVTTEDLIRRILIADVEGHLPSVERATERQVASA
jgi:hypothetical protein